jgi:hypothetical protein
MSHIARRIERLEDAVGSCGDESRHVIQIAAGDCETADAAAERYRAEHPDVPGNTFFIVLVPVSPKHPEVEPA